MLTDYINAYNKAKAEHNTTEMKKIQKEFASLGVDLFTLEVIARELKED